MYTLPVTIRVKATNGVIRIAIIGLQCKINIISASVAIEVATISAKARVSHIQEVILEKYTSFRARFVGLFSLDCVIQLPEKLAYVAIMHREDIAHYEGLRQRAHLHFGHTVGLVQRH